METDIIPVTTAAEYQDVSLLLSSLVETSTVRSFYLRALVAFGLAYSADTRQARPLLSDLYTGISVVLASPQLVAEEVEAVGLSWHVIARLPSRTLDCELNTDDLLSYYQRVSDAEWLRSPSVAVSFLLGFGRDPRYAVLVQNARDYLTRRMGDGRGNSLPLILFGQWLSGTNPEVDESDVERWLGRTHQPLKHLCILAVVLSALEHPLSRSAIISLQTKVSEAYYSTVTPSMTTVRALLAVVHLAEIGLNGEQIESVLEHSPMRDQAHARISAIIRADSKLFIEFEDRCLAQAPVVEFLAFYLYAAQSIGLDQAYIVTRSLKTQFVEWFRIHTNGDFRALRQAYLAILLALVLAGSVHLFVTVWWPLSSMIYEFVIGLSSSHRLIESLLDDVLKGLVTVPVYFVTGSLAALWLQGDIGVDDLKLDGVLRNTTAILKQILRRKE